MPANVPTFTVRLTLIWLASHLGTGVVLAQQPLPVSKGVYRMPYASGTSVSIFSDHTDHPASLNRYDMSGGAGATIRAAAAGCIRLLVDTNDITCPDRCGPNNFCDADMIADHCLAQSNACNGYSGSSSNCCERDVPSTTLCGSPPVLACTTSCQGARNNYVWIEHPNGEWTKYTHMQAGTVTGAGRFIGECIAAGTPLGIEGDVGFAGGRHLHFEVAVPDFVDGGTANDYFTSRGFLVGDGTVDDADGDGTDDVKRQNRIPAFCQVTFPLQSGSSVDAETCDGGCNGDTEQISGTVSAGSVFFRQLTVSIGNDDFVVEANAGASIRAGRQIVLSPGFHAELDSYFSASIARCDTPGVSGSGACPSPCP